MMKQAEMTVAVAKVYDKYEQPSILSVPDFKLYPLLALDDEKPEVTN